MISLDLGTEPKPRRRFFGLLSTDKSREAFVEAWNTVATGRLEQGAIQQLVDRFGTDEFITRFNARWRAMFERMIKVFAADGRFSEQEASYLRRFQTDFRIAKDDAKNILARVSRAMFLDRVANAAADDEISDAEMQDLERFAEGLGIPDDQWRQIAAASFEDRLGSIVEDILADGIVSPDERRRLDDAANRLRTTLHLAPATQRLMDEGVERWHAIHGPLIPVDATGVRLARSERCYFHGRADWIETRIERGVGPRYVRIASGELFLTDVRVLLLADAGQNKTVKWDAVLRVTEHDESVFELEKARGKSPVIEVTHGFAGDLRLASKLAARIHRGELA